MSGLRAGIGLALVAVAILALSAVLPALRPPQDASLEAPDGLDFSDLPTDVDPQDLEGLGDALDGLPPELTRDLQDQLSQMDPEDLQKLADAARKMDPAQVEDLASLLKDAAANDPGTLEDAGLSPEAAQALTDAMQGLDPAQQASLIDAVEGLDPAATTRLLQDADGLGGVDLTQLGAALGALAAGTADPRFADAVADLPSLADRAAWPDLITPGTLATAPQVDCPPGDACGGRLVTYQLASIGGNLTLAGPSGGVPWDPTPGLEAQATRTEVVVLAEGRGLLPTLGPKDTAVSIRAYDQWGPAGASLWQRGDGSIEATGHGALLTFELQLVTDADYADAEVPAGTPRHPSPPAVEADLREAGLAIAALAGLDASDPVAAQLNGLQALLRGFGPTDADPPATADGLVAAARAHEGCAATRALLFVAAAQALGTPARVVRLESGVSAEAELAGLGWRRMDLGGCGAADQPAPAPLPLSLTQAPSVVREGETFLVAGRTDPGARIDIYLEQGTPARSSCTATAGSSGSFFAPCVPPAGLKAGVATLRVRAGDPATGTSAVAVPVQVASDAQLTLEVPAEARAGNPASITATLLHPDGTPVAGEPIELRLDGATATVARTDANGTARLSVVCPSEGLHALEARGGGAAAGAMVPCTPSTLQARVEQGPDGTAIVGAYLGNGTGPVAIEVGGKTGNVTLRDGAFAYRPEVPPGPAEATVTAPDGSVSTLQWTERVVLQAWLRVAPQVETGEPVPLTLESESSFALPAEVLVVVDGEPWRTLEWTGGPLDGPTLAPGNHTFGVTVLSDTWQPAAPLAANTTAGTHSVAWDAPPAALRGQDLELSGTLLFNGRPAEGPVAAGLGAGMVEAAAGPDGRFQVTVPALQANGTTASLAVASEPRLWRADFTIPLRDPPAVTLDAPGLAFVGLDGTLEVQASSNEGSKLRVTVDGKALRGHNGTHRAAVSTWLVSLVTVTATATPEDGALEPATATQTVLLVNPWTTGALLLATAAVAATLVVRRRLQRRPVLVEEAAPRAVRLLHPALPKHVPWVFDPQLDGTLRFASPGAVARIEAEDGTEVPFEAQGRELHVPASGLPPGRHTLRFLAGDGHAIAEAALESAPLHAHLDAAMREVADRLRGRGRDGPVPLREFRRLLTRSGVPARHADAVRSAFERTLFSGAPCDRPALHACYAALGAAKEAQP